MKQKTVFLGAVVLLLLVFAVATMNHKAETAEQTEQVVDRNRDRLIRMHSPTLGNMQAKVVIVEFLDPACETCRSFYPLNPCCLQRVPAPRAPAYDFSAV